MKLLYLPFIFQGLCMLVDEFYFHEKRGLGLWERVGHPLDTITVVSCYIYLLKGKGEVNVYLFLCAFSCLFITKDEFVHLGKCLPVEHWLHSLLFILHPLSFFSAYYLWQSGDILFLKYQMALVLFFLLYQTFRWSLPWQKQVR